VRALSSDASLDDVLMRADVGRVRQRRDVVNDFRARRRLIPTTWARSSPPPVRADSTHFRGLPPGQRVPIIRAEPVPGSTDWSTRRCAIRADRGSPATDAWRSFHAGWPSPTCGSRDCLT